jgi:hypothetical protein
MKNENLKTIANHIAWTIVAEDNIFGTHTVGYATVVVEGSNYGDVKVYVDGVLDEVISELVADRLSVLLR